MGYAAQPDLAARFGADELARLGGPDRIAAALADAAAEIDAILAPAYALPLAGSWPLLAAAACDLARERLYAAAAPEAVAARARAARERIAAAAEGRMALRDADGAPAPRRAATARAAGPAPAMTARSLAGLR